MAVPFTYFLCFQYAVVARSYSLAPLLLFGLATVSRKGFQRIGATTILLILLASVSAQAFLLSIAIAIAFAARLALVSEQREQCARRGLIWAALSYLLAVLLIIYSVWPSNQASFVVSPNWSLANFIGMSRYSFQQAFGEGYWPLVLISLSLPLLWRGRGLFFFVVASLLLCIFGSVIYSNVWHHGFLILAWLFALWISCESREAGWSVLLALSIFVVMQCSWTWQAVRYDFDQHYSGSKTMASYLKNKLLSQSKLFGIGYPTVALQPYFVKNLYRNYDAARGGGQAFWRWSKSYYVNSYSEQLGSTRPDLVLLGYSSEADRKLWSNLITRSGYRMVTTSEGHLFWRNDIYQPENYELYQSGSHLTDCRLASEIKLGDIQTQDQLLWGFLESANGQDRWTSDIFEFALQRPPTVLSRQGARLHLDFRVPDDLFQRSGSIKITGYVSGRQLPPMVLSRGGQYSYVRDVSAGDLYWAVVPVAFRFDKIGFATKRLEQQRVAIVSSVGLVSP